jgi:protein ImuA
MTQNPLLRRKHHDERPKLTLKDDVRLTFARAHEVCGNARRTFAFWTGGHTKGPVLWIRAGWIPDQPSPEGVLTWMEPGRLMLARCRRPEDLLWSTEEALRSGAVQLVVADLPAPPHLTAIRRLHLAAETGAKEGDFAPIGLILTPGDGGAPGVETRWHMAANHDGERTAWHLHSRRARNDAPKSWAMEWDEGVKLSPQSAPS